MLKFFVCCCCSIDAAKGRLFVSQGSDIADNGGETTYILEPKAMGPDKNGAASGGSGKVNQTVQNWWYGKGL